MTQLQSTTNLSTTVISAVNFASILKPKFSKVLLRSGTGLVEIIILVIAVIYFPLTIKTNLVTTEAAIQPRTEIAKNSNTCGDRNQGDGIFDCNI